VVNPRPRPPRVNELAAHLFEDASQPLAVEAARWLATSRPFRAFAYANRDKIRKKLRSARDEDARRDVRAELRTAYLLVGDRRIELAWEAYGAGKGGPDFTVDLGGVHRFNIEVTRPRGEASTATLAGAILVKLRQLPPSTPNAVLVALDCRDAGSLDVAAAATALRASADRRDETFFTASGYDGTRQFYDRYLRLGGVFVLCDTATGDGRAALWLNPSSRIGLPARAAAACLRALRTTVR
jgi:hypothetical protein